MGLKKKVKSSIRKYLDLADEKFFYNALHFDCRFKIPYILFREKYILYATKKKYKSVFGRELNLESPVGMGEKLQWLKINVHEKYHTICADKLLVRNLWAKYGTDGLIPLLYKTDNYKDISMDIIPDMPCIVKCNTGCGCYQIIRGKKDLDIKKLREKCRIWLYRNFYYESQEWQYKNIKPYILIEKLLLTKEGRIPNDYKLHFINGELQFIYCTIDREGENYRRIYDIDWNRIDLEWVNKGKHKGIREDQKDICRPDTLDKMISIGADIAKHFAYVRVDFYEVDGNLYYGEITLHHGSGFDTFEPPEFEYVYGEKLILPQFNKEMNKWVYFQRDSGDAHFVGKSI